MTEQPTYRLLRRGDLIQRGDQPLGDDCETWIELAGWEIGMEYMPNALKPIRRLARMDESAVDTPAAVAFARQAEHGWRWARHRRAIDHRRAGGDGIRSPTQMPDGACCRARRSSQPRGDHAGPDH